MASPATASDGLCTFTNNSSTPRHPHTVRYQNALLLYWAQHMQPVEGEGKSIGYHSAQYLATLIAWADSRFLMASLHRGEPLSLPNSMQSVLCGHSPRHCLRMRKVLERHGLVHVQAGSFNAGGSVSARLVIQFGQILGPAEAMFAAERQKQREPRSQRTATDSPERTPAARTDSPPIVPPDLHPLRSVTSAVEVSDEGPTNERSCGKWTRSTVAPQDLALAEPCIRAWQSSPKCPPRRRGDVEKAIRSERDAETARRIAAMARDGVPERVLVNAVEECLAAYSPALDPRYRSPYVQSLGWFRGWLETAAEQWLRQRRHRQKLIEEQTRRSREARRRREDHAEHGGSVVASTTLMTPASFLDRYARARYLPPERVLLEEIAEIDEELARRLRDEGATKREIVDAVANRA